MTQAFRSDLSLREISEAMTPAISNGVSQVLGSAATYVVPLCVPDALGISIFCDEAVRKALVEWREARDINECVGDTITLRRARSEAALYDAITAALDRAQEKQP